MLKFGKFSEYVTKLLVSILLINLIDLIFCNYCQKNVYFSPLSSARKLKTFNLTNQLNQTIGKNSNSSNFDYRLICFSSGKQYHLELK